MQDSDQNVYRPTESAFQSAPSTPPQGFGPFDFSRAMSLGMESYQLYVGLGAGATLVWFLASFVANLLAYVLVGLFLLPVLFVGPILLGLYMVRRRPEMGILFKGFDAYGRLLGTAALLLLFSLPAIAVIAGPMIGAFAYLGQHAKEAGPEAAPMLMGLVGLAYLPILLMIPVMYYLGGRLILVFPLVVERGYGPMQAIKTSWNVTQPYQWWLTLFVFVTQVINGVGWLLCFVGALFSTPLSHAMIGAAIYMLFGEDEGFVPASAKPASGNPSVPGEPRSPSDPY